MPTTRIPRTLLGVMALLALVLVPISLVHAQGGAGTPAPGGQPANQAAQLGAMYFDQAIRYVARGRQGIPSIRDFYVKLDAKLELDHVQHEGQMRVWWQTPGLYRQELTTNNATTTKILNGNLAWIRTPDGRVQNLALSSEGQRSIGQLREDSTRLSDLTRFLTLNTLKGPGITFLFDGLKRGSKTYAGDWIKITRKAPGKADITFWLAYVQNPQTKQISATYPGIVRVQGDPTRKIPTEDFILKQWDSRQAQQNRTFRYPRQIEAYSLLVGPDGRTRPTRFLWALVDDIKINSAIDPSRFAQPGRTPQPGRQPARQPRR